MSTKKYVVSTPSRTSSIAKIREYGNSTIKTVQKSSLPASVRNGMK